MKKIILSLSLLLMMTFIGFSQSLPIDFDDAADNNFIGQGGSTFMADVSPTDGNNNVGQTVGGTDQYNSRIDLALGTYIDMTTANKTFTFDFYTTEAVIMNGLFQIGNEADGGFPIEMQFTTDGNIGWETITLDFTNATNGFPNAGDPVVYGQYAQLSIFTNFADFGTSTYYVDNIAGAANGAEVVVGPEPMVAAPTPTHDEVNDNILSVYSGAYTDLAGTDFNPGWGQATLSTEVMIEGNNTLKYANLNYQGTQLANPQDVSNHAFLHVDFWTADATALEFYLISVGSGEQKYDLTVSTEQWVSVDIPLSTYSGQGLDLTDIHQFKVVGDGNVWFDNWYFHSTEMSSSGASLPIDFDDAADNNFIGQGGSTFMADVSPTDGSNNVGQTVGGTDQYNSRIDLALGTYIDMTTANKTFTFDFYTTEAVVMNGLFQIGNEADGGFPIEMQFTTDGNIGWETITLDFTNATNGFPNAGDPVVYGQYAQLSIFTNFADFGTSTYYVDNIAGAANGAEVVVGPEPMVAAPTPTHDEVNDNVLSVYSGAYTDLAGTDFNPGWGQATLSTEVMIEGNNTLKYANLNYQGTQLANPQDVSNHAFLHVDFWTADATALEFYLISVGSGEQKYDLTVSTEQWVSVDIPLSAYSGLGLDLTDIHQFKVVGDGNVWFDNWYFYTSATEPVGNTCVDFEPGGLGDSWDWVIDANDDNPALVFASNPATDGINTSATAAQFTARQAGASFALTYTSDIDAFQFNATNSTMKIMVHKTVISDFAIKLEGPSPAIEIKIPNTVVGEWEELTFDFSAQIGNTYNRLVIIPDFDEVGRTQDNVIYFDNIKMPEGNVTPPAEPMTAAPDPTHDEVDDHVLSVYSGVYTDLAGTDFNPNWGQLTDVTEVMLESNNTLKYFNLNYQGTQLAAAQDVSGHKFLHVDFWTPNAESLEFYLISVGSGEQKYDLTITAEEWVSVDIPLDDYSNLGLDLTDIHQFKVVGNGNVWFDNLYFHTENIIIPLAEPTVAAPTPIHDESSHQVISVYSGAYNNLTGTDFNPNWGQQTTVEGVVVDNDFVIKYSNLNYQGMQFANQDVSGLDFLHIDFWTPNSTDLGLYLISSTGAEHEYVFTVVTEQWVSVDIPLSHFANAESNFVAPVDLTDVFQFKTEGNGTVYLDNIYFYNSVPLATDLVSFQADAQGKIIDLTWQTASETNNSHFEVEHTTNGIDFKMIGKVDGNGSTTEVSTYGFSHQAPIGVNYYRLRQVDFNGEYKYSQIVKAECTAIDNTIVYPNPAQDLINIDYISSIDEEVKVVITDITGRIVFSQILIANTGENHFNIDISTLPQGSYYLSLESSREYSLKAIIKE